MEGACLALIGDYANARLFAEKVLKESREFGESAVAASLSMLAGTLARVDRRWDDAVAMLEEVRRLLMKAQDWEDLPFVQIELQAIAARENASSALERVAGIVRDGVGSGALTVQMRDASCWERSSWQTAWIIGSTGTPWWQDWVELGRRDRPRKSGVCTTFLLSSTCARETERLLCDSSGPGHPGVPSPLRTTSLPEHRSCYLRTEHAQRLLSRAS
jgi:hypothetical protein